MFMAASTSHADLLSNDDFESDLAGTLVSIVELPYELDVWGADSSFVVGAENGISPNMGTGMLRMFDDGLEFTQVVQRVDVSQFADLIDADGACVDFSCSFNAPDGMLTPVAGISLFFIPEISGDVGELFSAAIDSSLNLQSLDSNLGTWEQVSIEGTKIPVGTRSILVQLSFDNNTLNGMPGYADTASMCINECADCTFDVCQALCICEDGELSEDFSVNGVFTNGQSIPGAYLLVKPNAIPEGTVACFGNGSQSIVLDELLPVGASVTLGSKDDDSTAVIIKNAEELDEVTFTLVLIGENGEECCSVDVTVELPECDCWQIDKRCEEFSDIVCNDDGTVDFNYTYELTSLFFLNEVETTAFHSFLIGLGEEAFEPDFFVFEDLFGQPLEFCETATFTTRIVGATPGSPVNFIITLHTEDVSECCTREQEIVAPDCFDGAAPPSSFIRGDMNEDGALQLDDVGPFVAMLTAGDFHVIADMNEDGALDLSDIQPFVDALLSL